jgi:CrcB protein
MNYLLVFLGAGLGGVGRYSIGVLMTRISALTAFPISTFLVNISGSFLMGLIMGYLTARTGLSSGWKLFLATGIMGGYTTFSSFSLETAMLIENGHIAYALGYVVFSVLLGLVAVFAGLYLMRLV